MSEDVLALSAEVSHLKRSVMRELLSLAVDPEILSMAGGLPAADLLPLRQIAAALAAVLERDGPRALQYSPMDARLRQWVADYMGRRGAACRPEQVFITNGAQQGLAILSRLFLDPGTPAVIEAVTFTGVQQITAGRGAEVRCVPTDLETGVDIEALEAAFQRPPRPRLAVLIPDFHNPLGVSISLEKRRAAAQLAARYGVPIIEDDPYSPLRFAGDALPPIKSFDQAGLVFYLGSFSKIIAPALRMGWLVAPQELIPRITVVRESLDLETSTLLQRAVVEFLLSGELEPHLARMAEAHRQRSTTLLRVLEQELGDLASWTRPQGGLFVWVTLPPEVDAWELFPRAVEHKVAYIPGKAFSVEGGHANTLRLNFSNLRPGQIEQAVGRLASVIRAAR
jgi:2-aminoadipate transaminase